MESYQARRIISVVVGIILVVIVIIVLASLFNGVSFSGSNNSAQTNTSKSDLVSTNADRSVLMSVRGPIVADENFKSYQIVVSPNSRVLDVYAGYLKQTTGTITLNNNIPAYEQFVYALDHAKLMDASQLTGSNNDTRGVCATGKLYEFEILKAGKSSKMLWTTSCSAAQGSLGANLTSVQALFTDQIPGANSAIGSF